MRTLTAIDALENAIALLKDIARGEKVSGGEILLSVRRYTDAAEAHREQEMKDERARAQLRELRRLTLERRA